MSQAIRTRYHGHSNTKPARITAKCEWGFLTVKYDDGLSQDENHRLACLRMMEMMKWTRPMVDGVFNHDYYWVVARMPE